MKYLPNYFCNTFLKKYTVLLFSSLILNFAYSQSTSKFNDGYLTVFKNTSASALGTTGTAIVLEEYLPSTTSQSSPNYSVAIPFASSAGSNGIVCGATTSSNGAISRSENGRYILVPGWSTNTSITGATAIGSANTTFTICAVRPVNGSGTISTGITGTSNWFTAANDYRGATSDDLTNYWVVGASIGVRTTTNGTSLTTVSSTSTNVRVTNIFNSQLYYSTGSGTNGIYQVGTGKSTSASTTSTNLVSSTGAYGFAVSPDFLTIYTNSATGVISRWTYSGTYSSGSYSGGSWSTASTGLALTAVTGLAVDWSGYSFSTSANGAIIYACNSTTLVKANDNGTGSMTSSTLRTISGFNAFKQLAFSPIKQTVSIGSATPALGNITKGGTSVPLFQFNLSADEGNSTIKKVTIAKTGTSTISTSGSSDIANFHLIKDANNNGVFDGGETDYGQGTVSSSNISFSVSFGTYLTEGSSANFLVVADVNASATSSNTISLNIASNKTINSTNYTTNIVNAGGSPVYMGASVPTGNLLTIASPSSTTATISNSGNPVSANLGLNVNDNIVFGFSITPAGGSIDFTAVNITTTGTANNSDINNFRLYYDADASGTINGGDVLLQTLSTLSNPLSFNSISGQTAFSSARNYLLVADIPNTATSGNTFSGSIASTMDVTTTATSASGTASGNTQYIGNPSSNLNNSGTPASSNVSKSATDFLVFGFQLTPTCLVNFSDVTISTSGTATASDVSNFRLYKDVDGSGTVNVGDVLVQTVASQSGTLTFSSLSQTSLSTPTNYLVIADFTANATTGNTLQLSISHSGDITLGSGTNTGTATGNTITIDAGTYGDFRSAATGNWSATSSWQTYSSIGTWVSASVAPTTASFVSKNVTILNGHTITADGTATQYCKNLTINNGGILYAAGATARFINVYGNITCNGTIGNGSTYDGIGFDVEGTSCTISGSGNFDCARIAKNSITNITTNLTFDMNVNCRYNGAAIYVNIAGATLNVIIDANYTLTLPGDATVNGAGAFSFDGIDGTGSGERGGSLTVNGTLTLSGQGTGQPTLFLLNNNTTSATSCTINNGGLINVAKLNCGASGAAGHTLTINNGGILNITDEPTSFITPSTTNNTFTFNTGSTVQYSKSGAQTVYVFGSNNQKNITFSGSGNKTLGSALTVNGTIQLSGGTFATGGNLTINSSGSLIYNGGSITGYTLPSSLTNFTPDVGTTSLSSNLTVNGTLFLGNNTLDIAGNTLNINGDFTTGTGVIKSNGSGSISIGGTGTLTNSLLFDQTTSGTTNRFSNITLSRGTTSGTGSITLGNSLEITGTLTLTNGTLNTGGFLTLVSNASGTARIASIPSTADISGNVKSQRYVPALQRRYRMFSPNTSSFAYTDLIDNIFVTGTGGSSNGFDDAPPLNSPSIYTYQESTTGGRGWKPVTSTSSTLGTGSGALVYVRGDRTLSSPDWYTAGLFPSQNAVTIDFNGAINKGTISPSISYTNTADPTSDGWNLVGNPYASQIDWNTISKSNLDANYYIYNPATGSYVSDNGTNYIASGQAFFVQATGSSPTISFNETDKVSNTATSYFKTATQQIEFKMIKDAYNSDVAWLGFDATSNKGFNRSEDAVKFPNSLINFGFYIDSIFTVQRNVAPMPNIADTFVLSAYAPAGTYSINVANVNATLPSNKNIYLIDQFNSNVVNLRSTTSYTFSITSNPTTTGNRFLIVINDPSLLPVKWLSVTGVKMNADAMIKWQTANEKNNDHYVVERLKGNTFEEIALVTAKQNTQSLSDYTFTDKNIFATNNSIQYYRIKQIDKDGKYSYSSIVAINDNSKTDDVSVFPNPASNLLNIISTKTFVGNTKIDVIDVTGKTLQSQEFNANERISLNISSYETGIYFVHISTQNGEVMTYKFCKD
ncbi:MAG: T9SS type A sorting domain-containing protein [Bacteroidota bacterium]